MRVNLRLVSYVIGLVVLASLFFNYASLYEVHPSLFSAQGWSKYLEVNIPSSGTVRFQVPVEPGMSPSGSDVVLTDRNGHVLRYMVSKEYPVPYNEVYEYRVTTTSPYFVYVPVKVSAPVGSGVFGTDWSYQTAFRSGSYLLPVMSNHFYFATGGSESPYNIPFDLNILDYSYFKGKIYGFSPAQTFHEFNSPFEYIDWGSLVCESNGSVCYLTGGKWSYIYPTVEFAKLDPATGRVYDKINLSFRGTGKYSVYDSRSRTVYYYIFFDSRSDGYNRDDRTSPGYMGVREFAVNVDTEKSTFVRALPFPGNWDRWKYYGMNPLYMDRKTGYVFLYGNPDTYHHGSEEMRSYIWVVDTRNWRTVFYHEYNLWEYFPISKVSTAGQITFATALYYNRELNDIYVFISYYSKLDSKRHSAVLVVDMDTGSVKYIAEIPGAYKEEGFVRDWNGGGFLSIGMVGSTYGGPVSGYGFSISPEGMTATAVDVNLVHHTSERYDPALLPLWIGRDRYVLAYMSTYSYVNTCWVDEDQNSGYVAYDGSLVLVSSDHASCSHAPVYIIRTQDGKLVTFFGAGWGGSKVVNVALIPSSSLRPVSVDPFGTVNVSVTPVQPSGSTVLYVTANVSSPGKYYLFYGSQHSWFHQYPQGAASDVNVQVFGPYDVAIRPMYVDFYAYRVPGSRVVLEVNTSDDNGSLVSQCFYNGAVVPPSEGSGHSVGLSNSAVLDANIDCYAFEHSEYHFSGVVVPSCPSCQPLEVSISPSRVAVGGTFTLSVSDRNAECYLLSESSISSVERNGMLVFSPLKELKVGTNVVDKTCLGKHLVVCSAVDRKPAYALLEVVSGMPVASGGGFVPEKPKVTRPRRVFNPVQPASPVLVHASLWLVIVAVLLFILRVWLLH